MLRHGTVLRCILMLAAVALAGCAASGPAHRTATKQGSRTDIRIFDDGMPECPFDMVGSVAVEIEGSLAEYSTGSARYRYHDRLRREAARHKCDAIVDIEITDEGEHTCTIAGMMIRFQRDDCRR